MEKQKVKKALGLGVFTLAMINIAAVANIRGLPTTAEYGLGAISFYLVATLIFFIPVSLIAAELATGWPSRGGVYTWVKKAFGPRMGFMAIWLQWAQNIFFYPAILSFVAATVAFVIDPALAKNKFYMASMIIGLYWLFTFINFFGMKVSGFISTLFVLIGTIFPIILLVTLGVLWLALGHPLAFNVHWNTTFPDIKHLSGIVFFVGVILSFAGMEMSAVHAQEVENPQRDYPKAIFIALLIILSMFIFGSLGISAIVPVKDISLVAGIMQAFNHFFKAYHLTFLTPIIAVMITIGALGSVNTWIVGPSKGLMWTARDGCIPPLFQRTNKHSMPVPIMLVQGGIVTLLALMFLLMPTVSSSFWILTDITIQMYLLMYLIFFVAAICLRYKYPEVKRAYKVPGGNLGMWIAASVGLIGALFALGIGFIPPTQLKIGSVFRYESFLVGGLVLMAVLPHIIYTLRSPSWKKEVPHPPSSEQH